MVDRLRIYCYDNLGTKTKFVVGATTHRLTEIRPLQHGTPASSTLPPLGMEKIAWETELKSVTSK